MKAASDTSDPEMAECHDPDLTMCDFIPPQYYQRYIALGRRAREMREKDAGLRTQIRFGDKDIELHTKRKGSNDRYVIFPMGDIEYDELLPKFDHTLKWNRRDDRPRRHISPVKEKTSTTDSRMEEEREATTAGKFRKVTKNSQ